MIERKKVERFVLQDSERQACERLFDHIAARITALSLENESISHDLVETSFKRGQIKALRTLLALREPPRTEAFPPGA